MSSQEGHRFQISSQLKLGICQREKAISIQSYVLKIDAEIPLTLKWTSEVLPANVIKLVS